MLKRQKGLLLIEILVAAVIVAIGLAGIGTLIVRSIQSTQDNSQNAQTAWIVQDLIGRMHSNRRGAMDRNYAGTVTVGTPTDPTACPAVPAPICSDHVALGASVSPVACDSRELALFDLWNVLCGTDASNDAAGEFIRRPALTVICTVPAPALCTRYQITLSWQPYNDQTQHAQYQTFMEIGHGG